MFVPPGTIPISTVGTRDGTGKPNTRFTYI